MFVFLCLLSLSPVAAWLYLAVAHGQFWKPLLPESSPMPASFPSVDIIVPARDEADILPHSLPSLLAQDYPGEWHVILVDDHSRDGTGEISRKVAITWGKENRLTVIDAPDLPADWVGKVAAMNAGVTRSEADMILFTDADIRHAPSSLRELVARAQEGRLDLVSRMVMLNCESFAEKLLIPAFVFFFAKLYPFRLANNPSSRVAAAAGGTMLVRRSALARIRGLASIKSALIDDCSLAKAIKNEGGKTELTLAHDISSLRPYPHIGDVWHMVARTAYTQLNYSPLMLVGTMLGLTVLYVAPPLLFLLAPTKWAFAAGMLGWLMMAALYMPMVRFYNLSRAWALTLPFAALVYGAATFDSARRYYRGQGGLWKGRAQA